MLYRMRNGVVEMAELVVVVAVMWLVIWATITYLVGSAEGVRIWISQHPRTLAILAVLVILDRIYLGSRERFLAQRRMSRNRVRLAVQLARCRPEQ